MKTELDINEITALTELLTLNVALEAVKIGKTGEGFASVAEELKTLTVNTAKLIQRKTEDRAGEPSDKRENAIEQAINDQLQATEKLFTSINSLSQTKLETEQASRQGLMNDLNHLKLTLETGLSKLS